MQSFDVLIAGGGPSGSSTAFTCARLGLNVLLVERSKRDKGHKICGGMISPVSEKYIHEVFHKKIPSNVLSSPRDVSIFMVSPSGRGGTIREEKLINVERDKFDSWLLNIAEKEGAEVEFCTGLTKIKDEKAIIKRNGKKEFIKAKHIVGADGIFSTVRKNIAPEIEFKTICIAQEFLGMEGIGNHFYMFFNKDFSPTYIYLVPKNNYLLLGNGIIDRTNKNLMEKSRSWIEDYLDIEFRVIGREMWFTPCSRFLGKGNVLLVGDAAGLCNAFSGEGIRFAVKSGSLAANSIHEAINSNKKLIEMYNELTKDITRYVDKTIQIHERYTRMRNKDLEKLVKSHIAPLPI